MDGVPGEAFDCTFDQHGRPFVLNNPTIRGSWLQYGFAVGYPTNGFCQFKDNPWCLLGFPIAPVSHLSSDASYIGFLSGELGNSSFGRLSH